MNGEKVQVYFDQIQEHILEALDQARFSIKVAMAWITDPVLIGKLAEKARSGVSVELIISEKGIQDEIINLPGLIQLESSGGELFSCGATDFRDGGIMHNKFCIIDFQTIITGSYNWTKQASRNDENITVIHDFEQAEKFNDKFLALKRNGTVLSLLEGSKESDSKISFTATKNLVDPGQSFELHWEVDRADYIEIKDGIGRVGLTGNRVVSVQKDTHFTIIAEWMGERKTTSLLVRIIKEPVLEYRLTYLDPSTHMRVQLLPVSRFPDLFVILEGQTVALEWESVYADTIMINEEEKKDASGKMSFSLDRQKTFTLSAFGIKHVVEKSFSIKPVKLPELNFVRAPLPDKIELKADLDIKTATVPSSLTLTGKSTRIKIPDIHTMKARIKTNQPSLKDIAANSDVPLRQLKKEYKSLRSSKLGAMQKLKEHFAGNTKILHFLKNLIKRHA